MRRPNPRAELVIMQVNPMTPYMFAIAASSDDAKAWIEKEAPYFGSIQTSEDIPYMMMFAVSLAFDPSEVVNYLMSYLNEDE